jgi:hypothetical protein
MHTTLLLVLLAGAPDAAATAAIQPARQALLPFKGALKGALTKAMETSPVAAVEVCSRRAPELAKEHSTASVTVGRAAARRRNPDNAGPAWLEAPMAALAREPSGTDAFRVVALPGGRTGYAEAIWTQPMCLTCHGEALSPEVSGAIRAAYPKDAATGFKAGEFRGVFWAELAAPR